MGRGWRLGRIGGVPVYADPSILLIAGLVSLNLWVAFGDQTRFPELSPGAAVGFSLLSAALFILSILAHELAHAVAFRARGVPVAGITLYMLGGATEATGEVKSAGDEFLAAVVGPATTAGLWLLFRTLHGAWGATLPHAARSMFGYLGFVNGIMAVFNMLPGFPLDGGRILLAVLWKVIGDRARAFRITARVGQGVALAVIAGAVGLALNTGDLAVGLWPAFIGFFLFRSATASLVQGELRRRLETMTASQVMSAPPPSIDATMPVAQAMERYLVGHDGEAFPVMEGGHVVGFVSPRTARGIPLNHPIRDAATGSGGTIEASPGEPMAVVMARLRDRRGHTVLVVDGGRLVGVIEEEDLARLLTHRQRRPPARVPRSAPIPPRPDGPAS